jgi:fructokinase
VDVLAVDSSYDDTLEQMCRLADVIQVSEDDLRGLFRVPDHRSALGQIAAWNPNAWLLLMQGSAAATLFHGAGDCSGRVSGVEAAAVTAQATPSALAGLLDSLLRNPGSGCEPHLRWALAAGVAATRLAALPNRALVAAELAAVQVD